MICIAKPIKNFSIRIEKKVISLAVEKQSFFFREIGIFFYKVSSSDFLPKKTRPLVGRQDRSFNQRTVFWAGNHLNSCPDSDLRKN